jgi:hypothetical protein
MSICLGHAFLNSGRTGIVTVVTKINDIYEGDKYYILAIKDWVDEKTDIKRCINWGNTLDPTVGQLLIDTYGSNQHIKFADKNVNLRRG